MLPLILGALQVAGGTTGLLYMVLRGRDQRANERLAELAGKAPTESQRELVASVKKIVRKTLPKVGQTLVPDNEKERTRLASRLIQAGFYSPSAMSVFLGIKFLLTAGPMFVGVLLASLGLFPMGYALLGGSFLGVSGLIGPSFWLDRKRTQRQTALRRGLPDACDLIVICMSGGLSLIAALVRVVDELQTAHPLLASELRIVEREVQLGHKLADALAKFGSRSDLPELQNLAAVVMTAEKYGSSMTRTLDKFSETLRMKRQQAAEGQAQKASTKVLFPTLLLIFPVILLIILGPAMIQVFRMMSQMQR